MKTNDSINDNGCSICEQGNENYTTFRPVHTAQTKHFTSTITGILTGNCFLR